MVRFERRTAWVLWTAVAACAAWTFYHLQGNPRAGALKMRKTWLEFCDKGISGHDISEWPITRCRKRGFMILSLLGFLFVLTSVAAYRRFRKSRDLDHTRRCLKCRLRQV